MPFQYSKFLFYQHYQIVTAYVNEVKSVNKDSPHFTTCGWFFQSKNAANVTKRNLLGTMIKNCFNCCGVV